VLRLALPSAGELLLGTLVGLVNTYLVGHLGAAPLAAVGMASQVAMTGMILFSAAGTGATALIARLVGAGDWELANRCVRQALLLAVGVGLLVTAPLILLARPALVLLGAEPEALALGVPYLRIFSLGFVLASLMYVGNSCMRGAGDARTPLLVMGGVNLVNIAVSWALVRGECGLPAMGVAGAATGAVVAQCTGGVLVVAALRHGRAGLRLRWDRPRLERALIGRMVRIGLPVTLDQSIIRLGMLSYMRVVASLGTAAFAAHQVTMNAESISFMPGSGFAVAATTLVGQGLGARDPDRARRDALTAFALAAVLMGAMGLCFLAFPERLVGFFTTDPEVIARSVSPLRLVGLAQPFLAAMMVFAGALRGAGDTVSPLVVNAASIWLLRVPLSWVFARPLGLELLGVWLAMSLDMCTRGLLLCQRFMLGRWRTISV